MCSRLSSYLGSEQRTGVVHDVESARVELVPDGLYGLGRDTLHDAVVEDERRAPVDRYKYVAEVVVLRELLLLLLFAQLSQAKQKDDELK